MPKFKVKTFPRSRISTLDVVDVGKSKHHIPAIIEVDVTRALQIIRQHKDNGHYVSFTAWLTKAISAAILKHEEVAAFLRTKRKAIVFEDINFTLLVEKEIEGKLVPMPMVIKKVQHKSVMELSTELQQAKSQKLSKKDIILRKRSRSLLRLYYYLPGCLRRSIWRIILKYPALAYKNMGNVSLTSIGMKGRVNGWFIPTAVHPLGFGISAIVKKPAVYQDRLEIREILNLTVLMDHDVIDGAPMTRFIADLCNNMEEAHGL